MLRTITSLFLLATLAMGATAQKDTPFTKDAFPENKKELKEAIKNVEEGDSYFLNAYSPNYAAALPFYEAAHKFNPNNSELNYKIGTCLYFSADRLKALPYMEKAFELRPLVAKDVCFFIGSCYHLKKDWDKAKGYYQKYLTAVSSESAQVRAKAQNLIRQCTNGQALEAKKARVWIDNVGALTNSKYPEYAPVISADESVMVYTSRRPDSKGGVITPGEQWHFEDLYMSSRGEDGVWGKGQNMGGPLNTKDHDATSSISPDGKQLFVYRSEKSNGGDLYVSTFKKGEWSSPKALGKNINTPHHEPGASISFDGKTLYFVSDKPGGLGDHDIYVSQWDEKKEEWGPGKNLGNVINTPFDDKSVFLHPDGRTLYFASEGHNSVGGLDIFVSYMDDNGEWGKPMNLGMPLNTPGNDMFLVVAGNGRYGYYASYKPEDGYGDKDIYKITFLGPEKEPLLSSENVLLASADVSVEDDFEPAVQLGESNMTLLVGIVKDAKTSALLEADVEVINNDNNTVVGTFHADVSDGKFVVAVPSGGNYGIAVNSEGYLFHSENVQVPKATGYRQYQKEIRMKKFEVGQKIVLKNIFFDYNKYTLRPESTAELERLTKLMNDYPKLEIELGGHTDTRGSDSYNQQLSENRARVVVEYLVEQGIDKNRLKYAGYGETQTVIPDDQINKMQTTREKEDAHQENRRTEFKVLAI